VALGFTSIRPMVTICAAVRHNPGIAPGT
jgi:hypothetical protein